MDQINEHIQFNTGKELIEELLKNGYEIVFQGSNGDVILSSDTVSPDFRHMACISIDDGPGCIDNATALSFYRDGLGRADRLVKYARKLDRFPEWVMDRWNHVYNFILIDRRLYQCQEWF